MTDTNALTANARKAIGLLSPQFTPAPAGIPRQAVAALASRHPDLCEREWQDGCAQRTYYRLTPRGLALKDK